MGDSDIDKDVYRMLQVAVVVLVVAVVLLVLLVLCLAIYVFWVNRRNQKKCIFDAVQHTFRPPLRESTVPDLNNSVNGHDHDGVFIRIEDQKTEEEKFAMTSNNAYFNNKSPNDIEKFGRSDRRDYRFENGHRDVPIDESEANPCHKKVARDKDEKRAKVNQRSYIIDSHIDMDGHSDSHTDINGRSDWPTFPNGHWAWGDEEQTHSNSQGRYDIDNFDTSSSGSDEPTLLYQPPNDNVELTVQSPMEPLANLLRAKYATHKVSKRPHLRPCMEESASMLRLYNRESETKSRSDSKSEAIQANGYQTNVEQLEEIRTKKELKTSCSQGSKLSSYMIEVKTRQMTRSKSWI